MQSRPKGETAKHVKRDEIAPQNRNTLRKDKCNTIINCVGLVLSKPVSFFLGNFSV